MEFPVPPDGLIASVEEVARRLHVSDLTPEQEQTVLDQLWDAQAYVEGELRRPLLPVLTTAEAVEPVLRAKDLSVPASWRGLREAYDDKVTILSRAAVGDGTYNLQLAIGLDGRTIPPIRRFVVRAAAQGVAEDPGAGLGQRKVMSVSAENQSLSFVSDPELASSGPTIDTLRRRWLRRSVYQRPSVEFRPWPYSH